MNTQELSYFARTHQQVAADSQSKLNELLRRSTTDEAFRQQLKADPAPILAEHFGASFEGHEIAFIENEADVTIVLPDPVDVAAELSEEELEAVAGGVTTSPVCSFIATVAATLWAWDEFVERDDAS